MSRRIAFTFPVTVTIYWPEGEPWDDELAEEAATGMIPQADEVDVGLVAGRIVWAKRYAEVNTSEIAKEVICDA